MNSLTQSLMMAAGQQQNTPTLNYIGFTENLTSGTTHTYTAHNIGTSSGPRREIFVVIRGETGGGGQTLSSATIGGVSATIFTNQSSGTSLRCGCFAAVSSGTTATIVLNFSASVSSSSIAVYEVTNRLNFGSNQTDYEVNVGSGVTSRTISTVTTNANGFLLSFCTKAGTATYTTSVFTEHSQTTITGSQRVAHASYNRFNQTSTTPTGTYSWTGAANATAIAWSFD